MVGAPGFLTTLGDGEAGGELVEFLVDILDSDAAAEMVGIDMGLELVGK